MPFDDVISRVELMEDITKSDALTKEIAEKQMDLYHNSREYY
jgi:hypothetical protein